MGTLRAALFGAVVMATVGALSSSAGADDASYEEGRKHFKTGVAYLQDPEGARFEEAYAEFKKAYELTSSPKVLGNLALCAMKLERDGEAIEAYSRYLKEVSDIDPDERAQCERDLQTLSAGAAHVHITVEMRDTSSGTPTLYDTRVPTRGSDVHNLYPIKGTAADLVIRPGNHVLSLKVGDRERARWEFQASPAASLSHTFVVEPEKAAPPEAPLSSSTHVSPAAIVVTGVGAAALVAGGVLGVVTLSKVRALENKCPNNTCPSDSFDSDVSSVRGYVRATDVTLLAGGIVTVAGLGWVILSASSEKPKARAAVRAGAACTGTGCLAAIHARF